MSRQHIGATVFVILWHAAALGLVAFILAFLWQLIKSPALVG